MNKPILDKSMAITRGALPGSNKLMVDGVPFREVKLSGGDELHLFGDDALAGVIHLGDVAARLGAHQLEA